MYLTFRELCISIDCPPFPKYTLLDMPILSLDKAGRRVGGKWMLWDVTLEVEPGEIVGVFGRSDSGKTSLARLIAGLDEPTSGSVRLGPDDDGTEFRPSLAFSSPSAAPELTLHENLNMFASLWGVGRRSRAKELAVLMELVGVAEYRGLRPGQVSSGAMRRFELARALASDSPLTVIDCLLDTLDHTALERIWDHILTLRRARNKSFVVMTSSSRVADLCGKIAVLHGGKIVFVGRPDDLRRLGGEDMVVLGDLASPALRGKIEERLQVVIKEEEGYLSFRVANGERIISEILSEFGSDVGCVYLKRPTLDDALSVLASGASTVAVTTAGGEA